MTTVAPHAFRSLCRRWRQYRKLSQLDLALAADVSQRHVSWLETGRSRPSREMVVRLSEAMDIPLRERNVLLHAAGYAAAYRESGLDDPAMAPVNDALHRVLAHHEPLPAVVVDRFWNVRMKNRSADLLLGVAGDVEDMMARIGADGAFNLALMTLHPRGYRPYIVNWEQAAPAFIRRLKREALASGDPEVRARFAEFIALADDVDDPGPVGDSLLPVLPLELEVDGLRLSFFSVISTFGTPQDITTDELRIETFYPTDAQTEQFFNHLG